MPRIERRAKRIVEHTIQDRIIEALSKMSDVVIHRNLVGTYETERAGWIKAGLGEGTADLIGWVTVVAASTHWPCRHVVAATHSMKVARFLAIECKTASGRTSGEQEAWLELARRSGAVAGIARSVEEAISIVELARRWEI